MFEHNSWRRNVLSFSSVGVTLLVMVGCSGSDGDDGAQGPAGPPGAGASNVEIFAQVDADGDGAPDGYAVLDSVTFEIKSTSNPLDIGNDSSLANSHKSFFFEGNQWIGGGGNMWAFDRDTFTVVPRKDNPSFQANREGTIGQGQVNTKSAATLPNLSKEMKAFLGKTQFTKDDDANVDICELQAQPIGGNGVIKAPADTIVHNMGYSPVGQENSPDGQLVVVGVRQGDHLLVMDNDPASPTFAEPVRFIIQRTGEIKDKSNAMVGTFTSQYAGFGGTAPGNLNHGRAAGATGGETDPETYVEPCDTTVLKNAQGEVWFWSVDVDGDTSTGMRVDTILTTPEVHQFVHPVVDDSANAGATSGLQYVGPWMGSLGNRAAGGFLLSSENQGENSEGIWDVTDPANPVEVERIVADLATVKAAGGGSIGTPGTPGQFADGQIISLNIDFTSTGGGATLVDYTYRALAGDDGSGSAGTGFVTSAYLEKNTATDPGPNFILNGLAGRAGTAEFNLVSQSGSGEDATLLSDELWLFTFVNGPLCGGAVNCDIFQIVDLSTDPPWLISEKVDFASAFAGKMGPENKVYQLIGGNLEVIDMDITPRALRTVSVFDPTTGAPWSITSFFIRVPPTP